MKRFFFTSVICGMLGGCGSYTQSRIELLAQAQRGVNLVAEASTDRAAWIEQQHDQQQRRLDDAFDQDVRARQVLTADWVIEHRRAYTLAGRAMQMQAQASAEASRAIDQNLRATAQAIEQVRHMLTTEQMIPDLLENRK